MLKYLMREAWLCLRQVYCMLETGIKTKYMQLLMKIRMDAVDTDGDGTPDAFSPTPADWSLVIGARLWLLARSTTTSLNGSAALTFQMSDTRFDVAQSAQNFKRRVYTTYVAFLTPKSRRES